MAKINIYYTINVTLGLWSKTGVC